jgi:large subunit ribosomal protein L15
MKQHELAPPKGSKKKRQRVGRGDASGRGSYSTRGMKGQKSRSGGGVRRGFEGGQLPLVKRMPHLRGFTNIFKIPYSVVNVESLEGFESGSNIGPQDLKLSGLIRSNSPRIKILGEGSITKSLSVSAHSFSKSARTKIEQAGGQVTEL